MPWNANRIGNSQKNNSLVIVNNFRVERTAMSLQLIHITMLKKGHTYTKHLVKSNQGWSA